MGFHDGRYTAGVVVTKPIEPLAGEPADVAIPLLVREHGPRLLALGRRFCGSEDEAEDLAQEVFLQAWQNWDGFDGRSRATTWLYTIAARACQRRHRKRAGEPDQMASLDELLPGPHAPDLRSRDDDGFERQVRREARDAVERGLAALPFDFRIALVLKDIVELSVADVAGILDVKPATVKTRVHRARLLLRQELCDRFPDGPTPPRGQEPTVCFDLLRAKLEALDRGVRFSVEDPEMCERCAAVFHQLDVTREACATLFSSEPPAEAVAGLLDRLPELRD